MEKRENPFFVGCVIISPDRESILLGKRKEDSKFTGPGGGAEHGETPKQAAIREAFEEADLRLQPEWLTELPMRYSKDGKCIHTFLVVLPEMQNTSSHHDPDKEVPSKSWKWYPLSEPIPSPMDEGRTATILAAKLHLYGLKKAELELEETLQKAAIEFDEEFEKKIAAPIGATSPDGKWVKTINGWRHKATGLKAHTVTIHGTHEGKEVKHTVHGIMGRHHGDVHSKMNTVVNSLKARHPNLKINRVMVHNPEEVPTIEPRLRKAQFMTNIIGTNLNTNEANLDNLGAQNSNWTIILEGLVHGMTQFSDSVKLMIGSKELTLSKLDDGIFTGYVREASSASGEFGTLLATLPRATLAAIISALRVKGYLDESEAKNYIKRMAFEQSLNRELQAREMHAFSPKNPFEEDGFYKSLEEFTDALDFFDPFDGFLNLSESLEKARPALPIGTVRMWGGLKYVKHADGWIAVGGMHHGKKMGAFGAAPTHHEFANAYRDEDTQPKEEETKESSETKEPQKELSPSERKAKIEANEKRIAELEAKLKEHSEKKKETPQSRPEFKTYAEAQDWMKRTAKKYKTKNQFLASTEYKEAYSFIQNLHLAEKKASEEAKEEVKPEPLDAKVPATEEKPTAKDQGQPLESDNPREVAEAQEKEEAESEYAFARKSSVQNKGEDLLGSARHKRNEWKGLEDAERNGTAEALVKRDNLMKQDPVDYMKYVTDHSFMGPMAAYLSLKRFPTQPNMEETKRDRREFTNKSTGEKIISGMSPYPPEDWEAGQKLTPEDLARTARKDYVDAFERLKKKSAELVKNEIDPIAIIEAMRKETASIIGELRKKDRFNATSNMLAHYHNKTLSTSAYRAAKTGPMMEISNFMREAKAKYGEHALDSNKKDLAEHARDVLDGTPVERAFGKSKSRTGEFNPAEVYVGTANRKGPDKPELKTPKGQESELLNTMKMRGIQFGNSVTDEERNHHLEQAALALSDLADVTGLPKEMCSFNGRLGLAIGARGHGTALAHYEPSTRVINLTRKGGVGSLAHEWGHMFDNVLNEVHGKSKTGYTSQNHEYSRPSDPEHTPVTSAMAELVQSPVWKEFRSRMRDNETFREMSKTKREYWNSTLELFARSFEVYVDHKLEKMGRKNTYLAGVSEHPFWPNKAEMGKMAPLFDKLFESFKGSEHLKKAWAMWDLGEALKKGARDDISSPRA